MILKSLNEKVLQVMQLIAEHDYITFEDLCLLFDNKSTSSMYLNYLKTNNMIQEFITKLRPSKAYCLSKPGWQILSQVGKLRVQEKFNISDYNYTKFPHNNMCLKVRIIFEKHPWVVDYKSSKVVLYELSQQGSDKVYKKQWKQFDAEAIVKGKREYRLGIEVELTQKSSESYAKKFINIEASRKDVDFICWFCSDEVILNKLMEVATGLQSKVMVSKYRFCLINEFLQKRFETKWFTYDGTKEQLLPWPIEKLNSEISLNKNDEPNNLQH